MGMETLAELLDIDTTGNEPSLGMLTEMEGNTPIANRPNGNPFSIVEAGEDSYWVLPEPPDEGAVTA